MSSRKVIWLVCNNVQPPEIDTHLRHQKFARFLERDGYDVYIIGASYLHYSKQNLIEGRDRYIIKEYPDLKYIFIKTSSYTNNTGIKRFYSNFQFAWRLFRLRKRLPKPDIVVHNTRIPCDFEILFAAKSLKAHYITETWDLWPLGFATTGLLKNNGLLMRLFYSIEKYMYAKAEYNIFTLAGGKQYISDHGWDLEHGGPIDLNHVYYINNGIDLEDFERYKKEYQLNIPELKDPNTFKVLYLGSISYANGVNEILETAKLFKTDDHVSFLIFGDGTERKMLEEKVKREHIETVHFLNKWVEIKYVPFIISCSDINLLNYTPTGEMKYGGSQGKLFQYLAAGKPIVSNNIIGYDIVQFFGAGVSENIKTPVQYKDIICSIMNDRDKYDKMSAMAKEAAKDFDFKSLYTKFKVVIDKVLNEAI